MRLSKKKERQIGALLDKKQKAYDKFYEEYKDKSLDELKEIFQRDKPGGVRKAAMLDIVMGRQELAQAEIIKTAAIDPTREVTSDGGPQELITEEEQSNYAENQLSKEAEKIDQQIDNQKDEETI